MLAAARAAVGLAGTILVPTYTFSFCRQEPFDAERTPTVGGPWSPSAGFLEYFRQLPDAVRSRDPIHSIAGQGPRARELLTGVAPTCFGEDSVFDRLVRADALVCLIGLPLEEATLRLLLHQRKRTLIRRACVIGSAQPPAEIGARGVSDVVIRELTPGEQVIDQRKSRCRSVTHRDRGSPIELDDR